MKVKELLSRMEMENPESTVVPESDGSGGVRLKVLPPENSFGEPIQTVANATTVLAGHVERLEKIRLSIAHFYGLPVASRVESSPYNEWVQFRVKSPTGRSVAEIEIGLRYVVRRNDLGDYQDTFGDLCTGPARRFKELPPDVTGYTCHVHKYVLEKEGLAGAIHKLCEAPRWLEKQREEQF